MRIRVCISTSLVILLASYGCGGGSSQTDKKEAQAAMVQAKSLHADDFAPADFQQGETAWTHAQAAEKEGKAGAARVLFASATIYFNKSATITKARRDALLRELNATQLMIDSELEKMKSDLSKHDSSPNLQGQIKTIASEVKEGNASIKKLVYQEDLAKAVATAKDLQTKVYTAQVILSGQLAKRK